MIGIYMDFEEIKNIILRATASKSENDSVASADYPEKKPEAPSAELLSTWRKQGKVR